MQRWLLSIIWVAPVAPRGAIAVGAYIRSYWFTSSTSFANPAVTLARARPTVRRYPTADAPDLSSHSCWGDGLNSALRCLCRRFRRMPLRRRCPLSKRNAHAAKKRILILCTGNSARSQMAKVCYVMTPAIASTWKAPTKPSQVRPSHCRHARAGIDISATAPRASTNSTPAIRLRSDGLRQRQGELPDFLRQDPHHPTASTIGRPPRLGRGTSRAFRVIRMKSGYLRHFQKSRPEPWAE